MIRGVPSAWAMKQAGSLLDALVAARNLSLWGWDDKKSAQKLLAHALDVARDMGRAEADDELGARVAELEAERKESIRRLTALSDSFAFSSNSLGGSSGTESRAKETAYSHAAKIVSGEKE